MCGYCNVLHKTRLAALGEKHAWMFGVRSREEHAHMSAPAHDKSENRCLSTELHHNRRQQPADKNGLLFIR